MMYLVQPVQISAAKHTQHTQMHHNNTQAHARGTQTQHKNTRKHTQAHTKQQKQKPTLYAAVGEKHKTAPDRY